MQANSAALLGELSAGKASSTLIAPQEGAQATRIYIIGILRESESSPIDSNYRSL